MIIRINTAKHLEMAKPILFVLMISITANQDGNKDINCVSQPQQLRDSWSSRRDNLKATVGPQDQSRGGGDLSH